MPKPILSPIVFDPHVLNRPIVTQGIMFWQDHVNMDQDVTVTITTCTMPDPDCLYIQVHNLMTALQRIGFECNLPFVITLGEEMSITIEERL